MEPRRAARGFTFVELMVVLAILSFAFTYAIIHLDGATGQARLASAGRQVGTTVEFLHGHAVQANRPMEMEIRLATGEWRSILPPRPSEAEADRQDEEEVLFTDWVALPKNIRFEGIQLDSRETRTEGTLVITFEPGGEISPNGFMIRLVSDEIRDIDQALFSVEVNGLTGEVSYLPGNATFDQVVKSDGF